EALLDRANLELALANVVEVLGRSEQHVDEWAEERRHRAEQRRERDEERRGDPAPRVLPHPEDRGEPQHDDESRADRLDHAPRGRVEEGVDAAEEARDHKNNLPRTHPARNARPTKRPSRSAAKAKTLNRSRTRDMVRVL